MDGDQEQDKRAELLKLWCEYGKTYNVFVPAEQPDPAPMGSWITQAMIKVPLIRKG
jgi:hypothetical protein